MEPRAGIGARAVRFFFMQIGSLVTVMIYFTIYGRSSYSVSGLRLALFAALAVQTGYIVLAWSQDYLKQFDLGFWLLFAVGAAAMVAGITPVVGLYQVYSPALLFTVLALTAALPPLLGFDWFTAYFMRRTLPRWQLKLSLTTRIGRVIGVFWIALFAVAAVLCAAAPLDWQFTFLYPNLLVAVGLTAGRWLPPLYLKLFPPEAPNTAEAAIMGMPYAFDPRAAGDVRAEIQFRVSGVESAKYWLRIVGGRCESFEGEAPAPNVTVDTPDSVWLRIIRGELDGAQALESGLMRVEGDATVLASLGTWFPHGR